MTHEECWLVKNDAWELCLEDVIPPSRRSLAVALGPHPNVLVVALELPPKEDTFSSATRCCRHPAGTPDAVQVLLRLRQRSVWNKLLGDWNLLRLRHRSAWRKILGDWNAHHHLRM